MHLDQLTLSPAVPLEGLLDPSQCSHSVKETIPGTSGWRCCHCATFIPVIPAAA